MITCHVFVNVSKNLLTLNKLRELIFNLTFLITKQILLKVTFISQRHNIIMHDLFNYLQKTHCLWCYETKSVKRKWYESMLIVGTCFSIFDHFAWNNFEGCMSIVKASVINPISGETQSSLHACFPSTHSYTITSARLKVNHFLCGSVKKFTGASIFTNILACLKI
jgi:hypothetical protein